MKNESTINYVKDVLKHNGWKESAFGHFSKVITDKEYRFKFNVNSIRLETMFYKDQSGKHWMKLGTTFYKDIIIHDDQSVSLCGRRLKKLES